MYKEHPSFIKPQGDEVKLWRYMDFTKFISLLSKEELFFARSDTLGDPFEGSYPRENINERELNHLRLAEHLPKAQAQQFQGTNSVWSEVNRKWKYLVYINSWHRNQHESAAMWRLYLRSGEGIAIQSTFDRLKESFTTETPDVHIGEVQYLDYSTEKISSDNAFAPFLTKRKSFEHENELRAVIFDLPISAGGQTIIPTNTLGHYVHVDLNKLIASIYVAPGNPKWFVELAKSVIEKYGLDKPVIQSTLDAKPLY